MPSAIVGPEASQLDAAEMTDSAPVPVPVPAPAPVQVVVYAKDVERLASFYQCALALAIAEQARTFVVLHGQGFEVAIVAMPEAAAAAIDLPSPPVPLEDTPIKPSFLVPSIEARRGAVTGAGGTLMPPEAAWTWRGQVHLDGVDPEGNVFQLRQPQA